MPPCSRLATVLMVGRVRSYSLENMTKRTKNNGACSRPRTQRKRRTEEGNALEILSRGAKMASGSLDAERFLFFRSVILFLCLSLSHTRTHFLSLAFIQSIARRLSRSIPLQRREKVKFGTKGNTRGRAANGGFPAT